MVIQHELTKNSIFILEEHTWFYATQTKSIPLGGSFAFGFGRGHKNPQLKHVCKVVLKYVSNHVRTIGFESPATDT